METKKYASMWDREDGEPTPGEWVIGSINESQRHVYILAERAYPASVCVARISAETVEDDELFANASLVMAAKDLLADLTLIVNDAEPVEDARLTAKCYNLACAAKAKAKAIALNIPWQLVTSERDRLRREEIDEREQADSLHRAATEYFGGAGAAPFWRGFFRRKFAKLIASGGDYCSVPRFDEFVADFYSTGEWTCDDAWELLIEERPPLRSIWELYDQAIHNIILGREGSSC